MLNEIYQALDPVAFTVGPFTARWYGLAYVAGFLCAIFVMYLVGKRWKIRFDFDTLCIVLICAMVGVIVGGRLGYVFFYNWEMYAADPIKILQFSNGGMSFHGGFIGALVAGVVVARIVKMPYLTLVDLAIIGVPLGLFFGRCANFVNGELWGAPTSLPWGVVFGGSAGMEPRHPSQLYEALLEGLVLFVVLYLMSRKRPPLPRGTFFGTFMVGYGVFRFLIEFVRQPDAQIGYLWGGWLTMGQVLSVPLVLAGIALLVYAFKKKLPQVGPQLAEAEAEAAVEGATAGEGVAAEGEAAGQNAAVRGEGGSAVPGEGQNGGEDQRGSKPEGKA